MVNKVATFYNTIRYLQPIQIRYRIFYFCRRFLNSAKPFKRSAEKRGYPLSFDPFIPARDLLLVDGEFCFLNIRYDFRNKIDWNFREYGKLWTYNLNYFEYLMQAEITQDVGHKLITDFCSQAESIRDGLEPYPVSLRGINWIKFLSLHKIADSLIDGYLYSQYALLKKNPEYHLLGNHLLENGFSLLFGAYYFQDEYLYSKSKKILTSELEEQILPDGAHFELSTMYHQIILHRLLDAVNLIRNNGWKDRELLEFLSAKAKIMLGWIKVVSWKDGSIPLLNDAAYNIAPTTPQLLHYASVLEILPESIRLGQSGYRKFSGKDFALIFDAGKIGASYQPGHAHADALNFELRIYGKPLIVDTGTSTYETGERRSLERSTAAHNTVEINGENQSEIWASHRVGKRANVKIIKDESQECTAIHDGYKKYGILHQRTVRIESLNRIIIEDNIIGRAQPAEAIARIHFHPSVTLVLKNNEIIADNKITIRFEGATDITNRGYLFAPEFNRLVSAQCIEARFQSSLTTIIDL